MIATTLNEDELFDIMPSNLTRVEDHFSRVAVIIVW